jgi:hypothetical protein
VSITAGENDTFQFHARRRALPLREYLLLRYLAERVDAVIRSIGYQFTVPPPSEGDDT